METTEPGKSRQTASTPPLFLSHGTPLMAVETNETTRFFAEWGRDNPNPQAIVAISAHWITSDLRITHWERQPVLHDFYGFPEQLYQLDYPAPGQPELAAQLAKSICQNMCGPDSCPVELDHSRGLDHGVWLPLMHMYPQANVPVVQISMPAFWRPQQFYQLGEQLAGLREQGVTVMASGAATHNLKALGAPGGDTPQWAKVFTQWLTEEVRAWNTEDLFDFWRMAPHGAQAHPTSDHLMPLFVAMGAADAQKTARVVHDQFLYGSLSQMALAFGEAR